MEAARTTIYNSNTKASYCSSSHCLGTLLFKIILNSRIPCREATRKCGNKKIKVQTLGLYCTNTEEQRPLIDPYEGLNFDDTKCGKVPSFSFIQLLQNTHRVLPSQSCLGWGENSFISDLTGSHCLCLNKLTVGIPFNGEELGYEEIGGN